MSCSLTIPTALLLSAFSGAPFFCLCGSPFPKGDGFNPAVSRLGGVLTWSQRRPARPAHVCLEADGVRSCSACHPLHPSGTSQTSSVYTTLFPHCCCEVLCTHLPVHAGAAIFSMEVKQPSWAGEPSPGCLLLAWKSYRGTGGAGASPRAGVAGWEAAPCCSSRRQQDLLVGWCRAAPGVQHEAAPQRGLEGAPYEVGGLTRVIRLLCGVSLITVPIQCSRIPLPPSQAEHRPYRWECSNTKGSRCSVLILISNFTSPSSLSYWWFCPCAGAALEDERCCFWVLPAQAAAVPAADCNKNLSTNLSGFPPGTTKYWTQLWAQNQNGRWRWSCQGFVAKHREHRWHHVCPPQRQPLARAARSCDYQRPPWGTCAALSLGFGTSVSPQSVWDGNQYFAFPATALGLVSNAVHRSKSQGDGGLVEAPAPPGW